MIRQVHKLSMNEALSIIGNAVIRELGIKEGEFKVTRLAFNRGFEVEVTQKTPQEIVKKKRMT